MEYNKASLNDSTAHGLRRTPAQRSLTRKHGTVCCPARCQLVELRVISAQCFAHCQLRVRRSPARVGQCAPLTPMAARLARPPAARQTLNWPISWANFSPL
jgi:hypothetical protein